MARENRPTTWLSTPIPRANCELRLVRDNRYRLLLGCDGPMSRVGYGTSDPLAYKAE